MSFAYQTFGILLFFVTFSLYFASFFLTLQAGTGCRGMQVYRTNNEFLISKLKLMHRHLLLLTSILFSSVLMFAGNSLPIIEIKADRTMIYPQRMELTGEETLMDILQLVPDLMIAGYEDVISNYNLRIDNCPMNGDTRLILS
jgi:hypothetical protein